MTDISQFFSMPWVAYFGVGFALIITIFFVFKNRGDSKQQNKVSSTDLKYKLDKTRSGWVSQFTQVLKSGSQIHEDLYQKLEEILVTGDIGLKTSQALLDRIRKAVARKELKDPIALKSQLKEEILDILKQSQNGTKNAISEELFAQKKPVVLMIVGVNGVGKTTTIGKIAKQFSDQGKKVLIAAGDTFRAAAVEQLQIWGERSGVEVIHQKGGKDPSAVIFDASQAAVSRNMDLLIIDTAGRLHTKVNLMEELKKMTRTVQKHIPDGPHHIWLVLDATTGQNALQQARTFHEDLGGLTGIILTKLDGTAKGGVLVSISEELNLPVRYIGVGEQIEDLRPFRPEEYVSALFSD